MNTARAARLTFVLAVIVVSAIGAGPPPTRPGHDPAVAPANILINQYLFPEEPAPARERQPRRPTSPSAPAPATGKGADDPFGPREVVRSVSTVGLFALVSLAPVAVLMVTAFVRINIVLVLLRQALGSPQVPGNQVLTALALLLTALVMRPVGEAVYTRAIEPLAHHRIGWPEAIEASRAGARPIKAFMLEQIQRTNHAHYFWALYDRTAPPGQPDPVVEDDYPLGVVATAYLLSELTTALVIGFLLYLPFLVVDLVVSAVLAAMGLFMLPPSLVSLPLKLILFVLADGWLHVATMLLRSFGPVAAPP